MNNRTTKMIVIAVLVVAFIAGVVSSTVTGDSSAAHTMPDGSTMDGGGRVP